jgi:hypothetical protein
MKRRSSLILMAIAGVTAMVAYVGVPLTRVGAAGVSMSSAGTTMSPANSAGQAPALPYGVGEVVKLYQKGISKDVIVGYINSTALPYHMNADEIIYLQTLGMPQEITQAMLQRDGQLQQQAQQYYQQPPTAVPKNNAIVAAQPPPQVVVPTTPAPDVSVIGSGYPYYDYGYYPYYDYSSYWPPVIIGGGWGYGWGWRCGGFRGGFGGFRGGGGFHGGFGGGGFHGGFGGGGHGGGHR